MHLKEERCNRGKTKVICSGRKFKNILTSSEKVFYGEIQNSFTLLVN